MLNSGKKFRALRDKKNKYSNSCIVKKKKNSERNKKPYPPPPFKLNGRSLRTSCISRDLPVYFRKIHSTLKIHHCLNFLSIIHSSVRVSSYH